MKGDLYKDGNPVFTDARVEIGQKKTASGHNLNYGAIRPPHGHMIEPGEYELRLKDGRRYEIIITHSQISSGGQVADMPFIINRESPSE